jgi:hypothetical protein
LGATLATGVGTNRRGVHMRLILILAALLAAGHPVAEGDRLSVRAIEVPLDPGHPGQEHVGRLLYRGGLWLQPSLTRFGGLSDLRVSRDGRSMRAISDCGDVVTAELSYTSDGALAGFAGATIDPIGAGQLPPTKDARDAEALVDLSDGTWLVAFERQHRIERYADGGAPLARPLGPIEVPPDLGEVAGANTGLEALARLADGRLLAVAEGSPVGAGSTRLWVHDGRGWTGIDYPLERDPGTVMPFRPTAAVGLPNGDVLVLERRFPPVAARVRRLASSVLRPGGDLRGTELARLDPPLTLDNLEGIDATVGPNGVTRIYLVSDDNGCQGPSLSPLPPQRTLLLMFELEEPHHR